MDRRLLELMKAQRTLMTHIRDSISSVVGPPETFRLAQNLTMRQMDAVVELGTLAPCSLSDVAEALKISLSSASVLVDTLVEKGVVIRESDPRDRRRVVLSLEPEARKLTSQIENQVMQVFQQIIDDIGPEKFDQWREVLLAVEKAILLKRQ